MQDIEEQRRQKEAMKEEIASSLRDHGKFMEQYNKKKETVMPEAMEIFHSLKKTSHDNMVKL